MEAEHSTAQKIKGKQKQPEQNKNAQEITCWFLVISPKLSLSNGYTKS